MPKINRVRIINFYYNNDARNIADETYSFYDGENALINLANGGGKSVLVQVMLQPIIPNLKLQNRNMISFYKKSSYPSFIMIEWLLDNKAKKDYLMTGIAIAPRSGTDENAGNNLNYFTFASHYDTACDFDIAFVPFVRKDGESQSILPFEKSREAVKNITKKNREMYYFSRDEENNYRQLLSSFGISQEEWKSIIAKMNNDEGGIEDLFEKCKTSDSVLNEWIIKTVEKVIQSTGSEEVKIHELLESLILDNIKNKEYINDQKIIKEYFEQHKELEEKLGSICDKLDSLSKTENEFSQMFYRLKSETENLKIDINNTEYEQSQLNEEKSHIDKEEISKAYYDAEEAYSEFLEFEKECKQNLESSKQNLKDKRKEKNILEASKIYKKLNELKGELNGLKTQIETEKGNSSIAEKIESLKYSIKLVLDIRKNQFEEDLINIQSSIKSNNEKITEINSYLTENRKSLSDYQRKFGEIGGSIKKFKEYEQKTFNELKINLNRNLLEELDVKNIESHKLNLNSHKEHFQKLLNDFEKRLTEITERTLEIQKEKEILIKEQSDLSNKLNIQIEKKVIFNEDKKSLIDILQFYEIPESLMYKNEILLDLLAKKIINLEEQKLIADLEMRQSASMAEGIEKGRVYHPEGLLNCLNESDINYSTGENYLLNLSEENRSLLLSKNPLLPFCIISDNKEIQNILKLSYENAFIRQVVPVTAYDKLDTILNFDNEVVEFKKDFSLICSYNHKIFLDSQRSEFLKNLNEEVEKSVDRKIHLDEELLRLRNSQEKIKNFEYEENYEKILLIDIENIKRNMETANSAKCKLEDESLNLKEEQNAIGNHKNDAAKNLDNSNKNIDLFLEFLLKNNQYMDELKAYNQIIKEKSALEKNCDEKEKQKDKLISDNNKLSGEQIGKEKEFGALKKKIIFYSDAKESKIIDHPLELLEREYSELNDSRGKTLKDLEDKYNKVNLDLDEKESDLMNTEILLLDYENVMYDEIKYKSIKSEISALEKETDNKQEIFSKAYGDSQKSMGKFNSANDQLIKRGMSYPMPKSEIKGDYANRIKNINFNSISLIKKINILNEKINIYNNHMIIINNTFLLKKPTADTYVLNEDFEYQFKELKEKHDKIKNDFSRAKGEYIKYFINLKNYYESKHQSITDIINSMETLNINDDNITYDKVYYYFEELSKKRESLSKYLSFYEQQLKNMEHTKKQVVDQCVSYATVIFEDIRSITEKSKVKLSGKSKQVKMLKIDIPEKLDLNVRSRIEDHISASVRTMVDLYDQDYDKSIKKYRDKIKSIVSSRELLNLIIGTNKIPISVYKVDLNEQNSGLKKWEEAILENSGGEKFVVFFTLVSVLISYTREATIRRRGQDSLNESKVIIMDNPFGKTSSEHLLKAVFDIANTFNIQLICLSDLSQSSITNRFSLIYRLSIRKRMYSDTEVLKIDEKIINKNNLSENERLEHAMIYQTTEQQSMFDFFEN